MESAMGKVGEGAVISLTVIHWLSVAYKYSK
jgi:hypothetical protein